MPSFFKNIVTTMFLFIVFLIFVIMVVIVVLSNIIHSSSGTLFFIDLLYVSGILPLLFAFWLVSSDKTIGDWKFGLLASVLFLILSYYHCLALLYLFTSISNFQYLLMLDECILFYVLRAMTIGLSNGLQNDSTIDTESNLELSTNRFRFLLTFFLVSVFVLYCYDTLLDATTTNLITANFSVKTFPYIVILQILLNTGLLPLIFTLWLLYSRLVRGNVYYHIMLIFLVIFIYCFQIFFVVPYYHHYPNDRLSYWILETIVLVMVYTGVSISMMFTDILEQSSNKITIGR